MEGYNKHYIDVDDQGRIVSGWSDGPYPQRHPTEQSVQLTDQGGYQFRLFPGGEKNPALCDWDGIPLYKCVDGEVLPRIEEEIAADRAAIPEPPPTAMERMEAQMTYTAMKTGTLLEEE